MRIVSEYSFIAFPNRIRQHGLRAWLVLVVAVGFALVAACNDPAPGRTFYTRKIEPILKQTCAGNTGGCHVPNAADPYHFVAGNLDVSSFETVTKRRDLLEPIGAYSIPLLLVKAVGETSELQVAYGISLPAGVPTDGVLPFYNLEVVHTGGNILQVGSEAYLTLLSWMQNGATENGLAPEIAQQSGKGPCSTVVPAGFNEMPVTMDPNFGEFQSKVQPIIQGCAAASCHGAPASDFYVTCGNDTRQVAFNFEQVRSFITTPVENSQILRMPLAVNAGGYFHTGGVHFSSRKDDKYVTFSTWAEKVGPVTFGQDAAGAVDNGKVFFAKNVQPLLLRRGCMFEACHSPASTNDFKLRSGSQGFFSAVALERNYETLRDLFMALEMPDARRGRAVAKGTAALQGGIDHRGGPVLEGAQISEPQGCPQVFDPATASAFCIMQEWLTIERTKLGNQVSDFANPIPIVYVQRTSVTDVARPREFDTFQPGSNLMTVDASFDQFGQFTGVGTPTAISLAGCPGVTGPVDVRSPDVRFDGQEIAFAMRTGAGEGLQVYTIDVNGGNCTRLTQPAGTVHNFDPAWSPDGNFIVFASTRGISGTPSLSRRADLAGKLWPQSDIWRMPAAGGNPEPVTFLTNSELSPQMMREGRIIMTTEKVSKDFYQLSGRRINWDLTDYHPLLAQRAESPFLDLAMPDTTTTSVGYTQATEIREDYDGNFLLVLSDPEARGGAGTIAIFNRSVGTFEAGRTDPGYLQSMRIPDPNATGRATPDTANATTNGAYRSPFPMPDGRILVSKAQVTGDLANATSLDWNIGFLDPRDGTFTPIGALSQAGVQEVEAVLAFKYPPRVLYNNRRQLVFGGEVNTGITGGDQFGVIHFPDAPLIFTLLNANLRRGRPLDLFKPATHVAFYREQPAPTGTTVAPGQIFESRVAIGRAPLAGDGSARVRVPAGQGLILELQDKNGTPLVTMREEHQVGPGEVVSLGIREELFNDVCGGCHGSISGLETDIAISADVLTGASESESADSAPVVPAP